MTCTSSSVDAGSDSVWNGPQEADRAPVKLVYPWNRFEPATRWPTERRQRNVASGLQLSDSSRTQFHPGPRGYGDYRMGTDLSLDHTLQQNGVDYNLDSGNT